MCLQAKRYRGGSLAALLVFVMIAGCAHAQYVESPAGGQAAAAKAQLPAVQSADLGALFPLLFMENRAGIPDATPFVSLRNWSSMFLTTSGPVCEYGVAFDIVPADPMLRVSLEGADESVPVPGAPVALFNFYRGRGPSSWYEGVPAYDMISYSAIYPGIDLVVTGGRPQRPYLFTLQPGSSLDDIKFRVEGETASVSIVSEGLIIQGDWEDIYEYSPVAWQITPSGRVDLPAAFKLFEPMVYGFDIPGVDPSLPLFVEHGAALPGFMMAGNFPWHCGYVAKGVDADVIIAGTASGYDIPFVGDPYAWRPDQLAMFSARLSADGKLKWCTVLDGQGLDQDVEANDYCTGVAIGPDKSIWLTGETHSTDFPMLNPFRDQYLYPNLGDIPVCRLNKDGLLRFSSYLGGSDHDVAYDIDVDKKGDAWITGFSDSADFPTPGSTATHLPAKYREVFVSRVTLRGANDWGYCISGGTGYGIAVDRAENVWITGSTRDTGFPTPGGFDHEANNRDAFVARLSQKRGLIWATYLGGSSDETGRDITVDTNGDVLVVGDTRSDDFPIRKGFDTVGNGGGFDGFLARFSRSGKLKWSSFIGGNDFDSAFTLCTDKRHNVYVAGQTASADFPLLPSAGLPAEISGYVLKLDRAGRPQYSEVFSTGASPEWGDFLVTGIVSPAPDNVWVGFSFR